MSKYAYTTLLATDDYVYGVLGLMFSLQAVDAKYPLHIIVTNNISEETLSILDEAEALYTVMPRVDFKRGEDVLPYALTLNKMHIFDLRQYDKVCFIDGDALVSRNIDTVFDKSAPGFCVLEPDFLSGVLMLMNPAERSFRECCQLYLEAGTDEAIINTIYNSNSVTNLSLHFDSIIHMSNGGTGTKYKYWHLYQLNSIEKIKQYVQLEVASNYTRTVTSFDKTFKALQQETGMLVP